jgi:hypothetical protein
VFFCSFCLCVFWVDFGTAVESFEKNLRLSFTPSCRRFRFQVYSYVCMPANCESAMPVGRPALQNTCFAEYNADGSTDLLVSCMQRLTIFFLFSKYWALGLVNLSRRRRRRRRKNPRPPTPDLCCVHAAVAHLQSKSCGREQV